jgi:formylglycine-generating enzyme
MRMALRAPIGLLVASLGSLSAGCSSSTTKISQTDAGTDARSDSASGGSGGSTGSAGTSSGGSGGAGGSVGTGGVGAGGSVGTGGIGAGGSSGSLGTGGLAGMGGSGGSAGQSGCPALAGSLLVPVDGFCIDRTEVTNAQYEQFLVAKDGDTSGQVAVCAANTSYVPTSYWPAPNEESEMPVVYVDWCDAAAYCAWTGKRLCGRIGGGTNAAANFTDATKSQWYDVCSNGGGNTYPYGDTFSPETCNGFDNPSGCNGSGSSGGTCTFRAVGSLTDCQGGGNYAGVYDLSGNVLEWEDSCTNNPDGGDDICRMRGGSIYARVDYEMACDTDSSDSRLYTAPGLGFRCCYN